MADYTTIAKVRLHLFGDSGEIVSDTILADLITSSSAWVEHSIGGDILTATYTDTLDGNGDSRILLPHSHSWRPGRPTTTITSVTVDGTAIAARAAVSSSNTSPEGYYYLDDGVNLVGYTFTEGERNVVIVYSAGFATVPTDIEQATREHVALRYRDRGHVGLASNSLAGEAATFSAAGTLAYIESVLAPYRILGVG